MQTLLGLFAVSDQATAMTDRGAERLHRHLLAMSSTYALAGQMRQGGAITVVGLEPVPEPSCIRAALVSEGANSRTAPGCSRSSLRRQPAGCSPGVSTLNGWAGAREAHEADVAEHDHMVARRWFARRRVTIANLQRMCEQGVIRFEEETVVFITGNGYETIEALEGHVEATYNIEPDLDEFLAVLEG